MSQDSKNSIDTFWNEISSIHKDKSAQFDFDQNANLQLLNTLRLKVIAPLITVRDASFLPSLVKLFRKHNLRYRMLGWGANQILQPDAIYLKLMLVDGIEGRELIDLKNATELNLKHGYKLWASTSLNQLTLVAMKLGIKGWEVFTGVPASLGGAVFMNAGTNLGEIGKLVTHCRILKANGEWEEKNIDYKKDFSYRENHFLSDQDILVAVTLKCEGVDPQLNKLIKDYLDMRNQTQPMNEKTCGCVFKNYSPQKRAGHFIDLLGLKGFQYNNIKISHKHANFFENKSENTNQNDFYQLIKFVNNLMMLSYGIKFELEVK